MFVDGALQPPPLRKDLDDGENWRLNRSYTFNRQVEVKLWDEDSPDDDDFLGKVAIDTALKSHATASFTGDGAHYKLWYSVRDAPEPEYDLVKEAIAEFERSSKPGVWPYIPKHDLIDDIEATVKDRAKFQQGQRYFAVNQGNTPLCGPAAIVFELACRYPQRYVQICQALYETGKFQGRTKTVKPSGKLIKSRTNKNLTIADWMLMAALRDTENELFDVESESGEFVMGLTTPWEMEGWAFEILGCDHVEYESTYFYGEFEAMREAKKARSRGGVAFLMIHSDMLSNSDPPIGHPNHWVSYLDGLHIDEGVWYIHDSGHIKFNCYSWGRKCHVDVDEGLFEDCFWGVVTAW
jgi:hypothetical protein